MVASIPFDVKGRGAGISEDCPLAMTRSGSRWQVPREPLPVSSVPGPIFVRLSVLGGQVFPLSPVAVEGHLLTQLVYFSLILAYKPHLPG